MAASSLFLIPRLTGAKEYHVTLEEVRPIVDKYIESTPDLDNETVASFSSIDPNGEPQDHLFEHFDLTDDDTVHYQGLMYLIFEMVVEREIADQPRFGDYIVLDFVNKDNMCRYIFFLQPTSEDSYLFYKICYPSNDRSEFCPEIPAEIVLGRDFPLNYYQELNSIYCQIDLASYREKILAGLVRKGIASIGDFTMYLNHVLNSDVPSELYPSSSEAHKAIFRVEIPNPDTGNFQELVCTIGLNPDGHSWCISVPPVTPTASFFEIVQTTDVMWAQITKIDNARPVYSEDMVFLRVEPLAAGAATLAIELITDK